MVRFIFWIIVSYFFAKLLGAAIVSVRKYLRGERPTVAPRTRQKTVPYENVQDVDYEEVVEKK